MSTPLPPSLSAPMPAEAPAPVVAAPMAPGGWMPGKARPLVDDALTQWTTRLDRGAQFAKTFHPQWQRALDRYAKAKVDQPKDTDDINALLDYRHVESKKAQLFHKTPEVNLIPVDPQDQSIPYDVLLPLREKFLNSELGPDGARMKRALHKTLIDALAASAFLIVKIGFEQATIPAGPDPMTGQVPTNPDGTPLQIPIWSRRFISKVSSKKLIVPDDFHDTDFDEASWLAVKGRMPKAHAKRLNWTLPADVTGTTQSDELLFEHGTAKSTGSDEELEYTEVWYKASLYDETVFNPELYRCLILVAGATEPAWHVDSPYQNLTPEGQLTDDSMIGNPIHVDTIRDLIDSAYVPSDLVVGEQLSVELNKFRTGLMRNRRARRPVTLVADSLGQEKTQAIAANAGPVTVPASDIGEGGTQRLIAVVGGQSEPRDNYAGQDKIESDWQGAIGTGDNQGGQFSGRKTTATEVRTVQGNSSARARTDEDRVREYVIRLVRKFDALVTRTATQDDVTKVLGQQAAALWEQWRALPGKYAYTIQPDSGRYLDANEYRTQKVNEYNLLRKDPLVNGSYLVRTLGTALGYDASKLVPQEQVGEKPEKPKISITFNAEQAMSSPAEAQLMLAILEQSGYQIDPAMKTQLMQTAQLRAAVAAMTSSPEHGGSADRAEPVNKHQTERTGGLQGVGKVS